MKKIIFYLVFVLTVSALGFALIYMDMPSEKPIIRTVHITETLSQTAVTSSSVSTEISVAFPINLNTASVRELACLDGIGEVLAQRIAEYRAINGHFKNRQELLRIDGIGEQKLNAIYERIYIENESVFTKDSELTVFTNEKTESAVRSHTSIQSETETQAQVSTGITECIGLDINTASAEDFARLDGITPELAEEFIRLRNKIHYFSSPYELLYADGMSEQLLAGILENVYVKNYVSSYMN